MKVPRLSGLVLAFVGIAVPAYAAQYWSWPDLLRDFFATSAKVGYRKVTLTDADAAAIEKKLGEPVKRAYTIYVGESDAGRTGYAMQDAEIGLHEPIDFGVRFGPSGAIERVEIMEYREPYGDEVRGERYRKQFVGKTANDPITAGQDIDVISGASYSSRSVALGVKRDTLVLQAALKNGL
jgi:Na+-translocating ferredoxin:NAD+ oxidoreductase RnfG subunit